MSKLAASVEQELDVTADWSEALWTRNLGRGNAVSQYAALTRGEQKQVGPAVAQAPALLDSHLQTRIVELLSRRCEYTVEPSARSSPKLQLLFVQRNAATNSPVVYSGCSAVPEP